MKVNVGLNVLNKLMNITILTLKRRTEEVGGILTVEVLHSCVPNLPTRITFTNLLRTASLHECVTLKIGKTYEFNLRNRY